MQPAILSNDSFYELRNSTLRFKRALLRRAVFNVEAGLPRPDELGLHYALRKQMPEFHGMKDLPTIYQAGDQVAVFTGKIYETLAHHGVVISPSPFGDSESLVYIPALDSYCMADDEALLRTNPTAKQRESFAQISFTQFDDDGIRGTYRRFMGNESKFSIIESDDGGFGFDITAPIEGIGLAEISLTVRVPSLIELTDQKCLDILREVLGLDHLTTQTTRPNSNRA